MRIEVKVPTVGESITEGILAEWKVSDGATVNADDALFELETDKVSMTVTAEKAGRVTQSAKAGQTVAIGSAVGFIETNGVGQISKPAKAADAPQPTAPEIYPPQQPEVPTQEPPMETPSFPEPPPPPPPPVMPPAPEGPQINPPSGIATLRANLNDLAPAVRRIVAEEHLDPSQILGTGKGGRITKEDALRASVGQVSKPVTPPLPSPTNQGITIPSEIRNRKSEIGRTTRKPMSSLRHRIAERMVESQHNSATLTTFNEADMSAVMNFREKYKAPFEKKHGVKLGFMSFFIKATIEALKAVPEVNCQIDGTEIVENHYYDIGVAVSTERGLVVPVIRDADRLSFAELEQQIALYAEKARNRTITLDELQGGVFTISNGGIFGSMLSTPILNPPQPAILGLHAIKKRPVVNFDDDSIVVRPMMYLAMSYDHRLIDGRESVTFLKRIVECIESPERIMVGV